MAEDIKVVANNQDIADIFAVPLPALEPVLTEESEQRDHQEQKIPDNKTAGTVQRVRAKQGGSWTNRCKSPSCLRQR